VARRRQKSQRTARANVKDLCDGRFTEYGALTIAAERHRRSMDDLISRTPADGLIAGIGSVNGSLFGEHKARCVIMAYDYTVLAGAIEAEGAVKAGFKKELEAVEDPQEREALYNKLVAKLYERGKAINMASYLEIDAVIDPADTRQWIMWRGDVRSEIA